MTEEQVICIMCPLGCKMKVDEKDGSYHIRGAACTNGEEYALQEVTAPGRVVMSVLCCEKSDIPTVAVKTNKPIPKEKIFQVMQELSKIKIEAPVKVGDIIVENILNLGIDIVATRKAKRI